MGNGEWGDREMRRWGSREERGESSPPPPAPLPLSHSLLPTPHSPLPTFPKT
ncbi:hypothetical protein H1Q63_11580 [Desmonostoc muscorum CCALA 125]|nr:hypothetical protein [Desmonostoc muscorum CCALA 125]